MAQHPLEPLGDKGFRQTAAVLGRDRGGTGTWRFASVKLKEPPSTAVPAWRPGDALDCRGDAAAHQN